jgi:NTE family protein
MDPSSFHSNYNFKKDLIKENLQKIFGDFDKSIWDVIERDLEWVQLQAGEILIEEGEIGDSLFMLISGKMVSQKTNHDGTTEIMGEILRGETIGEMAIFTDELRYSTVRATRDCVLVKVSKALFMNIIGKHPEVSLNVTRLMIERLKKTVNYRKRESVTICFIPIHGGSFGKDLPYSILEHIKADKKAFLLDLAFVNSRNLEPNMSDVLTTQKLTELFDTIESENHHVLFVGEVGNLTWNQIISRQADQIVIIADASKSPEVKEIEKILFQHTQTNISLLLIHPEDTVVPHNTKRWREARSWVNKHYHLRNGVKSEIGRISRLIMGRATGLVFAGGGAKGFAHLGVLKALEEFGIPIDMVGGTSVGALMAAGAAMNGKVNKMIHVYKEGAIYNPSGDYNIIPIYSLVKGERMKNMITHTIEKFTQKKAIDIEDFWLPLFIVAANYTKAKEEVIQYGDLTKALIASVSIPGVFPPVIYRGDILVDGGTLNNFPVDIMGLLGAEKIIGIDFSFEKNQKIEIYNYPDSWQYLKSKFLGSKEKRMPTLGSRVLQATLLSSESKRNKAKELLDLHFNPNVGGFRITDYKYFDKIVEIGYNHAQEVLKNLSDNELDKIKNK